MATGTVETVNVVEDCPAAIEIELGTVAERLLELRPTTVPPTPAIPLSVTVPVELTPPKTEAGLSATEASVAGVIVRFCENC